MQKKVNTYVPVYLLAQLQTKKFVVKPLTHVPPFRHGFGEQGLSERLFVTTVDELTQFDR
jgi:hypothetical protein